MPGWTIEDLESWAKRIEEKVREFDLDVYSQEFDIVNEEQMKEFMAYDGVVPSYPHWSFGKAYDRYDTFIRLDILNVYEMAINQDPCKALLLDTNSLLSQILVMAHVYAHNSFFKNNFMFRHTDPQNFNLDFRELAKHVRNLMKERPSDFQKIEDTITAAHSLRNQRVTITGTNSHSEGLNLIRFIAERSPALESWQRELLEIIDKRWEYFLPQIETKIMNEGWAAYWQERILKNLDLPQGMHMEFLDLQSHMVLAIRPGPLNPYTIGYYIFRDIKERWDRMSQGDIKESERWDGLSGDEKIFEAMRTHKDTTFIENYLTRDLMEKLCLVKAKPVGDNELEITDISDEEGWRKVKAELSRNVGMRSFPIVRAANDNHKNRSELYLFHEFDGRFLDKEYTRKTLEHIYFLWQKTVHLETKTKIRSGITPGQYLGEEFKRLLEAQREFPYIFSYNGSDFSEGFLPQDDPKIREQLRLLEYYKRLNIS